jgi:hypothetical protein
MTNQTKKCGATNMTHKKQIRLKPLKTAMILAALTVSSGGVAKTWYKGDLTFSIDTTISYGASVRVEERDERLVGKSNLNPFVGLGDLDDRIAAPGRWSINSDNGNLNYDDGDLFSNAIKLTSDIAFSYDTWGGFFRVNYFYDFENADREDLTPTAREFVGEKFRLLDAYVYKDFDIGNQFASVRLGRQVVSWGESTFIQQGINVINPIDVSKIRVAGAELKEAFLPIDMVSFSTSLTDNLSMEAVYLLEFEQTDPDPAGTYFGTNDFATPGGEYVALGFGIIPEYSLIPYLQSLPGTEALVQQTRDFSIQRKRVAGASDDGQYGISFKYYSEPLNNTEFGFYYLNYHSRLPLISGVSLGDPDRGTSPSTPNSGAYFTEYPEDINLYGISFNTVIPNIGWALQGEMSYRDNVPLQIDDVEVLFAALSPLNPLIEAPYNRFTSQLGDYGPQEIIQGWERHKVSQLQFTTTKLFGPNDFFKSDSIAFIAEVGFTHVWDLPSQDVLRYNGPGTDTGGGASTETGGSGRNPVTESAAGFATDFSWGYRMAARFDYLGAFGTPWNISPRIAFNHDVNGTTPGPGGNFVEGRKSLTLGVKGIYLEKWSADLSYTRFSGAGIYNLISDRDFASFNIKYSF